MLILSSLSLVKLNMWLYRHPRLYDLVDTMINLGISNVARSKLIKSLKGKVLEVGVGSGKSIYYFRGSEFYGIDISIPMIKVAKSKLTQSARVCVASAYELPFKAHSFDIVVFIYILRVLEAQAKVLGEAFRVGERVIVLEFKPLPKLLELFSKTIFGGSNMTTSSLKGFRHNSYLNRFDIYYSS